METPHFLASIREDQVILTAEQHHLVPAVLFEMLGATSLRAYNIENPKEESMYLAPIPEFEEKRNVISELPVGETQARIITVVASFTEYYEHLRNVSDRQVGALAEYARRRLDSHRHYDAGER